MTVIPLTCDPDQLPSIDDLVPHLNEIVKGYLEFDDLSTAPRYRVGLSKADGTWRLVWGDETEVLPVATRVLRRGLFGRRLYETARDIIDNYRGG